MMKMVTKQRRTDEKRKETLCVDTAQTHGEKKNEVIGWEKKRKGKKGKMMFS